MKKIIFIDIDRTLCNSKSEITDRTINAINNFQDNGGIVVISSGRNIKYIESLNTSALYFIALNGSIIYDCSDKKIIYQSNISQGLNETLYLLANEFNLNVSFYSYYDKYCNHDEKNSVVIKENYQFF